MERSFSPILRKIAGEVVSKPKRSFTAPTEVCLEDWWLSKPMKGDGIAVSGRPMEIRKWDDVRTNSNLASPKKRYASREFNSTKVVKRHGATMLETSGGIHISLCGFINKSRTQQNGFTSEVCRDFIYGFPFNWYDYTAAETADEKSKSNENLIGSLTPDVLDSLNGAGLHDFVLSLTDTERRLVFETISNNLMLNPQAENASTLVSLSPSPSSPTFIIGLAALPSDNSVPKASEKHGRSTSVDVSSEQDSRKRSKFNQNSDEGNLCQLYSQV